MPRLSVFLQAACREMGLSDRILQDNPSHTNMRTSTDLRSMPCRKREDAQVEETLDVGEVWVRSTVVVDVTAD